MAVVINMPIFIEMENCLRELLLEGKAVRMDELGIFKIGLRTKPADTADDFNARDNVVGCRMNLYLGKRFKAVDLYKDLKIREADFYSIDEDAEGEDAVNP